MNVYLMLLFAILAVGRLTSLITSEYGPLGIFLTIRYMAGYVYVNEEREMTLKEIKKAYLEDTLQIYEVKKSGELAEMISCPYCMSIWVSFVIILLFSWQVFSLTIFEFFIISMVSSLISIYITKEI